MEQERNHEYVVLDTTKVLIFKQITTSSSVTERYGKVVLDTTKVLIFKQITTDCCRCAIVSRCFRYHKGTDFQANHNVDEEKTLMKYVVLDTTKVLIFKQITT